MTEAPILVHRIQNEFLEMPGLRLTIEQASRLWALERDTSRAARTFARRPRRTRRSVELP